MSQFNIGDRVYFEVRGIGHFGDVIAVNPDGIEGIMILDDDLTRYFLPPQGVTNLSIKEENK